MEPPRARPQPRLSPESRRWAPAHRASNKIDRADAEPLRVHDEVWGVHRPGIEPDPSDATSLHLGRHGTATSTWRLRPRSHRVQAILDHVRPRRRSAGPLPDVIATRSLALFAGWHREVELAWRGSNLCGASRETRDRADGEATELGHRLYTSPGWPDEVTEVPRGTLLFSGRRIEIARPHDPTTGAAWASRSKTDIRWT